MEKEPGNSQAIETKQKTGKAVKSKDKDNGGGVSTIVTSASCGSISLSTSSITNINNTTNSSRVAGGDNLSGDVSSKPESSNGKRRKNLNLAHIIKEDNKDKPILVSSVRDLSGIGEGEGFHHSSSRLSSTASPTSLSSSLGNLGVGVVGISPSALISQNHRHNSKKHKNNDESGVSGVAVAVSCSTSQSQLLLDQLQTSNSSVGAVGAVDKLSSISTSKVDIVKTSQTSDIDKDEEDDNIIILDDEDLIAELTQSQRQSRQPPFTTSDVDDDIIFLNDIEDNSPVKYREIATWTAEDDMPSPLSELSPAESPLKAYHSQTHLNNNNSATSSNSNIHNRSQFDQLQLQHQQHLHQQQQHSSGFPIHHHHHHHHNHRDHHHQKSGSSSQNHHRPILSHEFHHHPLPPLPVPQHQFTPSLGNQQLPECFTVSSQLLTREARLYENVPTSQSGLETLEILLGENHSTNNLNFTSTQNNNTASTSNNSNSGNSAGGKSNNSGVGTAELLSVTDLLSGAGGCLVVGGPPSRTSWADSGRESLSFDGENNNSNSNGSSRNLLLIPPPPPPPINYITGGGHHSTHSGFVGSCNNPGGNNIMMQSPSHNSHQGHSHSQAQQSHSKRSRRERLVRQKQAIEETFLPIPGNSEKNGTNPGGNGHHNNGSGYLAVPSPRRAILNGSVVASNFAAAAASPISLQRHPPAQQIMLQENKKNRPLIACESPYGCMTGGPGTGGTNDWNYGGGNGNGNGKSNMLRCKSPQRGRGRPGQNKGQNQSFDYGELPSHQMFPKRHLLTSRQYSQQYNNNGNGTANSPYLQPNQQHRSFPAGLFRDVWNHFDTHYHRTTNALESWHSKLKRSIVRSHPNFFEIICIDKETKIDFLKSQYSNQEISLVE